MYLIDNRSTISRAYMPCQFSNRTKGGKKSVKIPDCYPVAEILRLWTLQMITEGIYPGASWWESLMTLGISLSISKSFDSLGKVYPYSLGAYIWLVVLIFFHFFFFFAFFMLACLSVKLSATGFSTLLHLHSSREFPRDGCYYRRSIFIIRSWRRDWCLHSIVEEILGLNIPRNMESQIQ